MTAGCAPYVPNLSVASPTTEASVAAINQPFVALHLVPSGVTIEVTFRPLTPFSDTVDCYRWPSHCVSGLQGGVFVYRPGDVLYYEYMPVGDYTMHVVVTSLDAPETHEETSYVRLGVDIEQAALTLNNGRQVTIAIRGEATRLYDARICEGSGSGASLHSSSTHRIVCSVADGTGATWSMEASSPRELYEYMRLQICTEGPVMMRQSQYAATFACQPADPSSPMRAGVLVERRAAQ